MSSGSGVIVPVGLMPIGPSATQTFPFHAFGPSSASRGAPPIQNSSASLLGELGELGEVISSTLISSLSLTITPRGTPSPNSPSSPQAHDDVLLSGDDHSPPSPSSPSRTRSRRHCCA